MKTKEYSTGHRLPFWPPDKDALHGLAARIARYEQELAKDESFPLVRGTYMHPMERLVQLKEFEHGLNLPPVFVGADGWRGRFGIVYVRPGETRLASLDDWADGASVVVDLLRVTDAFADRIEAWHRSDGNHLERLAAGFALHDEWESWDPWAYVAKMADRVAATMREAPRRSAQDAATVDREVYRRDVEAYVREVNLPAAVQALNDAVWFGDGGKPGTDPQREWVSDDGTLRMTTAHPGTFSDRVEVAIAGDLSCAGVIDDLRAKLLQPATREAPHVLYVHPRDVELWREMLPGLEVIPDGPAERHETRIDAFDWPGLEVASVEAADLAALRLEPATEELNRAGRRAAARGKDPSRRWRRRMGSH